MKTKVMIAIPTVDGWIHSKTIRAIVPQLSGRPLSIISNAVPCERARNRTVESFLTTDCTHLFTVDADTIPPVDCIERMLKVDADIVTGITPILNQENVTSNVFTQATGEGAPLTLEEAFAHDKPFEITAAGVACMLIKREVLEKMEKPIFTSLWFQDGKFVEGDVHFCGKARDKGFKIMADPSIVCGHIKQVEI